MPEDEKNAALQDPALALAAEGARGFAGRRIRLQSEDIQVNEERLALKRVPTRKAARPAAEADEAPPAKADAAKRQERAAQAALGMLGEAARDPEKVAERCDEMSDDERQRLAKLRATAANDDEASPLMDEIDQQLGRHGIRLLIKAGTVNINIGAAVPSPAKTTPKPARDTRASSGNDRQNFVWTRRLQRLRDFLNGH